MRSLSTGILSGWQESAAEKTDFATLGASFQIANGQATKMFLPAEIKTLFGLADRLGPNT